MQRAMTSGILRIGKREEEGEVKGDLQGGWRGAGTALCLLCHPTTSLTLCCCSCGTRSWTETGLEKWRGTKGGQAARLVTGGVSIWAWLLGADWGLDRSCIARRCPLVGRRDGWICLLLVAGPGGGPVLAGLTDETRARLCGCRQAGSSPDPWVSWSFFHPR